jgi:hypothetical protein
MIWQSTYILATSKQPHRAELKVESYGKRRMGLMRKHLFRPRVEQMESRLAPSVVNLHAGDNLQAALNNAQPGDVLVLDAGAAFTGPITLPNKAGNQWITIESSALASLPGAGQRVGPEDAGFMPKILSPGAGKPALQTAAGAHNYRFLGIEFSPATKDALVYDLIDLGDGSGPQTALAQVPHDLVLDQCYIHAWLNQPLKRGIALNSAATDILDSYIAGFKVDGQDSQAIAGWNGPGPFKIDNNYLEAAGENVIFGGAVATIPNLIPSDIEIRDNLITKQLSWDPNDTAAYAGQHWTVKNLLELKNAQRVTIDGNQFENNWIDAQVGFAIVLTPRGDQSGGPWVVVQNVTLTNNLISHTAQGINLLGSDDASTSRVTRNILIQNNAFEDLGTGLWGSGGGLLFQLLSGLKGGTNGVVIDHNDVTACRIILSADGVHTGFVFTNNVIPYGEYGVIANAVGEGTVALQSAFPGYTFQDNIIIGADPAQYPVNNTYGPTPNESFVSQVYLDLLQRPVDQTGMANWTAALAHGMSQMQVVEAIETSLEYRTIEVTNLYTRFLHRAPDESGLDTFTAFLANGGSLEQVAQILSGSSEYFLTQGGGTNDGFLDALYRDALNRPVDAFGRASFDRALNGGASRADIARAVFASTEFRQNLVESFYQAYLNRAADSTGLNVYVRFLGQGGSDETLIAALVGSAEYTARVAIKY